jgi:signal transduction histidine kinase
MLYVTSHDLKAPLLNIRGFSSELKTTVEELESALPDTAEVEEGKKSLTDCLQYIDKSAGRMSLLLDGLLLVSRSRRIPMEISRVSVSKLLTSVLEIHQFRIRQENATILISELPDCMGDFNMLTQVWSNLIDNSLKYKHPDRAPLIRIEGRVEEDASIYTIRDNGLGFAAEHATNLFQLFHRLNPSKSVEGTGIGLTVVKRFLQRMGGSIEAVGWPGQGAEFVIRLPLPDTIISA